MWSSPFPLAQDVLLFWTTVDAICHFPPVVQSVVLALKEDRGPVPPFFFPSSCVEDYPLWALPLRTDVEDHLENIGFDPIRNCKKFSPFLRGGGPPFIL